MTAAGPAAPARRILVIKLGALGDFVQALGPAAAIRRHHSGAHVSLLTTRPYAALAGAAPYFDAVWIDPRARAWSPAAWLALRRRLRGGRFDRVYDLQTSDRSGFYFRLMGPGRRPEWSGIVAGCSHPHANPARDAMHTLERQAEQLAMAGIAKVPPPDLGWLDADVSRFAVVPPYVLLVPGGAPHRRAKRWPAARYGALAGALGRRGLGVLLIGGAAEAALMGDIRTTSAEARDLAGKTSLAEVAALARGAAAAVGNDTGPMHLIAATGCPTTVLFSAESDPALCAPRAGAGGGPVRILRRAGLGALGVDEVLATVPAPR